MSEPWFTAVFGDPRERYDVDRDMMYIEDITLNDENKPVLRCVEGTPREEEVPPMNERTRRHMFDDTMIDARNAQVLAVRVHRFLGLRGEIRPEQYYNIAVEFKKLRDEPEWLCPRNDNNYWKHYYAYLNAMAKEVLEEKEADVGDGSVMMMMGPRGNQNQTRR